MKAFFDISLPTNWSQLKDRQLTFLFAQLAKNRPAYDTETRCLLKWAQLIVVDQQPDGSFIVKRKRNFRQRLKSAAKHFKHPFCTGGDGGGSVLITASQIFNATRFLSFIENLPLEPIRISRIGIHRALPADFMEVPFEKYLYCDNIYQGYLQTKDDGILAEMAKILYDSNFVRANTAQRVGVFYWFAALKSFFSRKFHYFLQPIDTAVGGNLLESMTTAQKIEESMNSQIRALTKGDITKEKQILKKSL